jgi:hypothetical protein
MVALDTAGTADGAGPPIYGGKGCCQSVNVTTCSTPLYGKCCRQPRGTCRVNKLPEATPAIEENEKPERVSSQRKDVLTGGLAARADDDGRIEIVNPAEGL